MKLRTLPKFKAVIFKSTIYAILITIISGGFNFVAPNLANTAKSRIISTVQAAGKDDFFNSIKALPDCSSVPAGVVCKWKTVPFESQAELNSYTNSVGSGYDPDDNDVITYDPTVGMARVAIPAFSPSAIFYTLTESPKTSISPTDQCLKFQNLPNYIGSGDPLVIGDYPNGTFEVILVKSNSSCPRIVGAGGQAYVTRGINSTTPQAWASGSPIRTAIKKVGVGNTLDVPLRTEGVISPSAPDQGCGPACTTWYMTLDTVYDKSYLNQNKLPAGKTFSIGGAGNKSMVTMQVGNDCKDAHGVTVSGCDKSKDISGKVNLRHGAPQGSGGGSDWKLTNGITNCSLSSCEVPTIGHDNGYRPQVGALIMRPNTVLRWHVLIEAKYGDYDRVTLWLSDQDNNAVLIHNRLMMSLGQDSAMPDYDAGTYSTPNQISYWHLGMDVSSYGLFTNTTYQDLVSWFSNLTLVRGLTRKQIEASYLPIKPVIATSSNIAPYVSITHPVKNGINYPVDTNISISATASDFDGTVSKVEFLKNNILIPGCTKVTTPYFCTLPLDTLGSFVLTARATDNKGVISTSNPVTVATDGTTPPPSDITPPTISLITPANASTVSGTVSITANALDNVGIANVQFKLNNNNLGALDSASPYTYPWNTTTVANGTYNITAVAKDNAGNSTTSATRTVTVNNTGVVPPPTNQLPQGTLDEVTSSGIARGWSYDPDSSTAANPVHIYVDSPAGAGKTPIGNINTNKLRSDVNTLKGITGNHGFEYTIPTSLKDGKNHTLYAYAIDINDSTKSTLLTGSPKSFTFAAPVTPPPVVPPPVVNPPPVNPPPPPTTGGGGGSTRPTPPPSVEPTPVPSGSRNPRGKLVNHNGTIYFLGADVRYPFPSAAVFLSWGSRFEDVIPANSGDLKIPVGPVVEYKTPTESRHPRTTLVNHNGTIYFLGADVRYPFPSAEVFLSWGVRFQDVVPANSGDTAMPVGPIVEMKR